MRRTTLCAALACAAALAATATPALAADNGGTTTNSGGSSFEFDPGQLTGGAPSAPDSVITPSPEPVAPAPQTAHVAVLSHGVATAPSGAPLAVRMAVQAANHLRHKPYVMGRRPRLVARPRLRLLGLGLIRASCRRPA